MRVHRLHTAHSMCHQRHIQTLLTDQRARTATQTHIVLRESCERVSTRTHEFEEDVLQIIHLTSMYVIRGNANEQRKKRSNLAQPFSLVFSFYEWNAFIFMWCRSTTLFNHFAPKHSHHQTYCCVAFSAIHFHPYSTLRPTKKQIINLVCVFVLMRSVERNRLNWTKSLGSVVYTLYTVVLRVT